MRRTARALSVAVLAGAVLGGGASAALADPSAEVSPGTARPGGDVSLSVSCDPVGQAAAPDSVEATSRAFDQGSVRLTHVPAADDDVSGPEYRGTARLTASAGGGGTEGAAGGEAATGAGGAGTDADSVGPATVPEPTGPDPAGGAMTVPDTTVPDAGARDTGATDAAGADRAASDAAAGDRAWTVGGTCPAAPGEQEQPWNTTFTVARGDHSAAAVTAAAEATADTGAAGASANAGAPCPKPEPRAEAHSGVPGPAASHDPGHSSCAPTPVPVPTYHWTATPAPVEHGVQAGGGGAFTPSVPALATGAALIAAAFGGAFYRLRGRGARRSG